MFFVGLDDADALSHRDIRLVCERRERERVIGGDLVAESIFQSGFEDACIRPFGGEFEGKRNRFCRPVV